MDEMREIGKARREKAVSMAMKRKEEYLGARVPKELRERVVSRAKEMSIPVSILIRNTLEEAFKEGVVASSVLSSASCSRDEKINAEKFSSVLGWETIELNKTVHCSGCGTTLQQGTRADLGLGSLQPVVICRTCKESL